MGGIMRMRDSRGNEAFFCRTSAREADAASLRLRRAGNCYDLSLDRPRWRGRVLRARRFEPASARPPEVPEYAIAKRSWPPILRDPVTSGQCHPVTAFRFNKPVEKPRAMLSDRIRERMRALDLGIMELADRSKIAHTTIRGLLSGYQETVTQDKLYRLAKALQTTMEWLAVGGPDDDSADQLQFLLSSREFSLLRAYRNAGDKSREKIDGYIDALPKKPDKRPSRRAREGGEEDRDTVNG